MSVFLFIFFSLCNNISGTAIGMSLVQYYNVQ